MKYAFLIMTMVLVNLLVAQTRPYEDATNEFSKRLEKAKAEYEGFPPIPFQAPDLDGNNHFLTDHKDQVLILQFWQLYCEPCRSQITSLNKLLEEYNDQGIAVLSFVDDYGEELETYVKNTQIDYPIIPNSRELGMQAYGGELGYPRVFIIDKYGIVRKLVVGASSYDELDLYKNIKSTIEEYLKE